MEMDNGILPSRYSGNDHVSQLFGGSLTLRDYDGQVAEALAMVRALNKMTKAGMPESVRDA